MGLHRRPAGICPNEWIHSGIAFHWGIHQSTNLRRRLANRSHTKNRMSTPVAIRISLKTDSSVTFLENYFISIFGLLLLAICPNSAQLFNTDLFVDSVKAFATQSPPLRQYSPWCFCAQSAEDNEGEKDKRETNIHPAELITTNIKQSSRHTKVFCGLMRKQLCQWWKYESLLSKT